MNSLRSLSLLLSTWLVHACATATGTYEPLGADHPASPGAPEVAVHDPSAFLRADAPLPDAEAEATGAAAGAYVCPMHEHVSSDQPGDCPECGMQLVPREAAEQAHEEHDHGR